MHELLLFVLFACVNTSHFIDLVEMFTQVSGSSLSLAVDFRYCPHPQSF